MPILSFDRGMRTVFRLFRIALRIRVSMSATGSVIVMTGSSLPARLRHAGDVPLGRKFAHTEPAALELPVVRPIPPTEEAAVVRPARPGVLLQLLRNGL